MQHCRASWYIYDLLFWRVWFCLTTYVTVPGLALVTAPFLLYQLFKQLLQPLVLLTSCVPACVR